MSKKDFKEKLQVDVPPIENIQKDITTSFKELLDKYEQSNSFKNREFLVYLSSAIFLVYKEKFPQIATYLLFRTKSDLSFIDNLKKEFKNDFFDSNENFFLNQDAIEKDISGIRLVLDTIKESNISKSNENPNSLYSSPKIAELYKEGKENDRFKDKVE